MSALTGMNGENFSPKYIPGMIHCKLITFGPGGQQFTKYFPPVDPYDFDGGTSTLFDHELKMTFYPAGSDALAHIVSDNLTTDRTIPYNVNQSQDELLVSSVLQSMPNSLEQRRAEDQDSFEHGVDRNLEKEKAFHIQKDTNLTETEPQLEPILPNFDKISKSSLLNYTRRFNIAIPRDFTPRQIREEVKHHFNTVLRHFPVNEKDVIERLEAKIDAAQKNYNPYEHLPFLYDYE